MTDYYANEALTAYSRQLVNDQAHVDTWSANEAAKQAAFDEQHAAWEQAYAAWEADPIDGNGDPIAAPVEPTAPEPTPQPTSTATLPTVYTARDVDEQEWITTASGDALVVPGRVVLTSDGGATEFALSADDLAAQYTDTNAALT